MAALATDRNTPERSGDRRGFVSPPLRITCARAGFRRAGVAHPAGATDYEAGAWTAEQLAVLETEPLIQISPITSSITAAIAEGGLGRADGGGSDAGSRGEGA